MSDNTNTTTTTEYLHDNAEFNAFVNREVLYCQSSLVDDLLKNDALDHEFSWDNVSNLYYVDPDDAEDGYEEDENAREIFEWWLCTTWFIEELEKIGECILRNDYGTWWGRTTTGQSITLDWAPQKVWTDLQERNKKFREG